MFSLAKNKAALIVMIDNKLLKEIQELSKEYDELERNYNPNHKEDDSEEIKSVETDDFLHINA